MGAPAWNGYLLIPDQKNLTVAGLLQEVEAACGSQEAELAPERRAQAAAMRNELAGSAKEQAEFEAAVRNEEQAEFEAAMRNEAAAMAERQKKRVEDMQREAAAFRDGILAALHAAEEPDPFASIRGDFDLSAPDSHQWKTSFQLQGAEKCGLLKAPPTAPTSASVWTLACVFRAPDEGYEGMVKAVGAALNLKYQPDERAANMNQVFFADPAKPSRRVFVGRIGDTTVRVAVVRPRISPSPRRSGMASTLRSRPYNRAAPRRRPVEWASLKSRMTPRTL